MDNLCAVRQLCFDDSRAVDNTSVPRLLSSSPLLLPSSHSSLSRILLHAHSLSGFWLLLSSSPSSPCLSLSSFPPHKSSSLDLLLSSVRSYSRNFFFCELNLLLFDCFCTPNAISLEYQGITATSASQLACAHDLVLFEKMFDHCSAIIAPTMTRWAFGHCKNQPKQSAKTIRSTQKVGLSANSKGCWCQELRNSESGTPTSLSVAVLAPAPLVDNLCAVRQLCFDDSRAVDNTAPVAKRSSTTDGEARSRDSASGGLSSRLREHTSYAARDANLKQCRWRQCCFGEAPVVWITTVVATLCWVP